MILILRRPMDAEQPAPVEARPSGAAGRPALRACQAVGMCLVVAALPRLFPQGGGAGAALPVPAIEWPPGGGERVSSVDATDWRPVFIGADAEVSQRYEDGHWALKAYANRFNYQDSGKKVGAYGNSVIPKGWRADSAVCARTRAGLTAVALRDPDGGRWCVNFGFVVKHEIYPTPIEAEVFYGLWSLLGIAPSGTIGIAERCPAAGCEQSGPHAEIRAATLAELLRWLR
jgi:hypothetical protein